MTKKKTYIFVGLGLIITGLLLMYVIFNGLIAMTASKELQSVSVRNANRAQGIGRYLWFYIAKPDLEGVLIAECNDGRSVSVAYITKGAVVVQGSPCS